MLPSSGARAGEIAGLQPGDAETRSGDKLVHFAIEVAAAAWRQE